MIQYSICNECGKQVSSDSEILSNKVIIKDIQRSEGLQFTTGLKFKCFNCNNEWIEI